MAGQVVSAVGVGSIADKWKELCGENNWKDMLDPLDIDLRRSILNYGDRALANGNAFNDKKIFNDKKKVECRGFSRYPAKSFFTKLGIAARNEFHYTVTDFIYSRLEIKFIVPIAEESTWSAYVAVATDEAKALLGRRDIVISWRGTTVTIEDIKDFEPFLVPASDIYPSHNNQNPQVHMGFHSIYTAKNSDSIYNNTSARDQVLNAVRKLVNQYKDEDVSITVTGYSLGSALATLNAVDIAANDYNKPEDNLTKSFPVTAIVFASPMVGDQGFKNVYDDLTDVHVLRVENVKDIVPILPPIEIFPDYLHVGERLPIDPSQSPYLRKYDLNNDQDEELTMAHNLDVYLLGVAGTQGSKGGFNLEVPFDIATVNKSIDGLNDDYNNNIPDHWWGEENKGMVLQDDGTYKAEFYIPDPPPAPVN